MKMVFRNLPLILLFLIGVVGQLAVISPSGQLDKNSDLLFWSSHAHDAMWHISVSNEIQKGFPLENPVFAGEKLVNYHIFSDILPAILNKFIKIPNLFLYFWLMPIIYSILLGWTAYLAGKEIGKTKLAGLFSIFAVYFIGSFGFIVTLLQGKGIGGESLFWATQIQSSIGNPPQILSNIFVLAFIYFLALHLRGGRSTHQMAGWFLLITLLVSLSLSKVYAGMVVFPASVLLSIYRIFKHRKFDLLIINFISLIITLAFYLPFSKSAGQYLIFEPLWYVRNLFSDPSRIGIKNFGLILQHYQSLTSLKSKIGFARYDILGLILIIFGNLGIRSLGFSAIPKVLKNNLQMGIFLLATASFSFLIPNLFLQKGVATNTSQTFQYLLLVFGILLAITVSNIFSKLKTPRLKAGLIILILILSLPTQIGLLYQFYSRPAFAKISKAEIEALNFLKNNSDKKTVIMTPPYDKHLDTKEVTPPIWDWFDTSYVAALSERSAYFADYEQVDIMGYQYEVRRINQELIFNTSEPDEVTKLLINQAIDFIYFPKPLAPKINFSAIPNLQKIFENNEVEIWKVSF